MDFWVTVVDDEALCLTNARNLLGDEGIKVSCLKSGQDLLKFVQKNTPDLVLLDVMMPGLDGFETLKRLRGFEDQNGRTHIPVIFLTGENDAKAEQRGLALGASDFIRKPFNKEILLRRIDNTIKNKKTIELLTEEAKKDKLTGFWNKTRGTERIGQLCRQKSGTLLIMDLDNFKLVNDLFGHDMGDKVLQAFADIIRRNTREYDTISRIGGDEFLAFIEDLTDESYVASETIQLNADFAKQARCLLGEEHGLPLGISVGAVMVPKHGREYEELFSRSLIKIVLHKNIAEFDLVNGRKILIPRQRCKRRSWFPHWNIAAEHDFPAEEMFSERHSPLEIVFQTGRSGQLYQDENFIFRAE